MMLSMPKPVASFNLWRFARWTALAVVLLVAVALGALWQWVQTDHFRQMLAREASAALGVELEFGALGLSLRPLPALRVDAVRLKTEPPLTAERIELRPSVPDLLAGRPVLALLSVQKAKLPQVGVDGLLRRLDQKAQSASNPAPKASGGAAAALLGSKLELEDIVWQGPGGQVVGFDASARLGPGLLPTALQLTLRQLRVNGLEDLRGTVLSLQQQGGADGGAHSYAVDLRLRGVATPAERGRITGQLNWKSAPTHVGLTGQLNTQGLDLRLVGKSTAKGLQPVLSGLLDAKTTLSAQAPAAAGLLDALQADSPLTVRQAVLHGMDLAKAVKTVGMSRGGETPLNELSGQLHTQGRALQLTQLVARSGVLGATGQVAVSPQGAQSSKLSGQVHVALGDQALPDAAKGIVGVPLQVGGTLESPELSLSRSALIGAAVGSVLMPGAGTAAGASLGDRVGEKLKGIFGK
ncbi:MAG: hypothetical protein RLZZ126_49 [Pseudomonadota bacterium]|jgi:hypothetical protein